MIESMLDSVCQFAMFELRAELHKCMDSFESRVSSRFSNIKVLDLGDIRKEVDVLRVEIHSLTESHMIAISMVVPPFF